MDWLEEVGQPQRLNARTHAFYGRGPQSIYRKTERIRNVVLEQIAPHFSSIRAVLIEGEMETIMLSAPYEASRLLYEHLAVMNIGI